MNRRAYLVVLPLVLTSVGGFLSAAEAAKAPKPVCNLIADAAGDATYNNVPGADGDDIVGGDVASDGTKVTGVIRLKALAANDPQAPLGRSYFVEFAVKGAEAVLFVNARTYPTGTLFTYGYRGIDPNSGIGTSYSLGAATGVVDLAKGEIRITAPNAGFAPSGSKLPKSSKLTGLAATSWRMAGQGLVPSQQVGPARVPLGGVQMMFDDGAGGSYTVGAPSCVKPGA